MSRKYAEDLVGQLERNHYNTQRDVANQAYQTNWQSLQNQYQNLQEKLKRQQEQSNRDFANGLVNVSEGSFNRMQNVNEDLANRGMTTSGTRNLYTQADTAQKGEDIRNLLGTSNNIAVNIANQLKSGGEALAKEQAELNQGLGEALGEIGAAETAAQMEYNKGLAGIVEAAAQRKAANAAASGGGTKEYDDKLEQAYLRAGIAEVLRDDTLTNIEKEALLKSLYGLGNSEDILDAYYSESTISKTKQDSIDRANELYEEAKKKYNDKTQSKKKPQAYEKIKTPGQEGYEEQKSQIQKDPYANRYNITAGNVQSNPNQYGTGVSANGNPYSYPGGSNPQEAAEIIELYKKLQSAEKVLNETKNKNYDLYDLYETLYGNR